MYVVRLDPEIDRDALIGRLADRGVASRPYFAPLHLQPFYRATFGFKPGDFPITERVAASTLALPFSSRLADDDVRYVAAALRESVAVTRLARTPAIVVSGHTMALAVVRALGEAGVPVVVLHHDARDIAQASRHAVAAIRVPHPMRDEAGFVDALVARGREFGGSVLFPVSDESTVAVSRNKPRLGEHYTVACPDWAVAERFIDKSRTYEIAAACGVPAPRTVTPMSEANLREEAAWIGYPVLLKPAESHRFYERFKRKMVRADTEPELVNAYRSAVEAGLAVMVQEIIPGADHTVVNYNAYFWQGQPLVEFTARQLRKAPPALGSPRVADQRADPGGARSGQEDPCRARASKASRAPSSSRTAATAYSSSWRSTDGTTSPGCLRSAAGSTSPSCTTGTWPRASCRAPSRTGRRLLDGRVPGRRVQPRLPQTGTLSTRRLPCPVRAATP